ncbi:hypothetical protein PP407_21300, partial [Mycobacteroides abscessus]|nr:hypothetical protein [Mycobacteroides abscessus]
MADQDNSANEPNQTPEKAAGGESPKPSAPARPAKAAKRPAAKRAPAKRPAGSSAPPKSGPKAAPAP